MNQLFLAPEPLLSAHGLGRWGGAEVWAVVRLGAAVLSSALLPAPRTMEQPKAGAPLGFPQGTQPAHWSQSPRRPPPPSSQRELGSLRASSSLRPWRASLTMCFSVSPQGRDCTVPINTCIQNPCLHGGTCHLSETHKGGFR